ncbi:MAG: proline--tRNA ligase [Candidatus Omnitrophica bacterium]|nr:proline--tRNA ligase [Candidatus Omnitrophota bacterium]
MRWSNTYIPTLREDPSDAEVASHKLMLRAGFIRRLGSGAYSYLPLGLRILRNIENIIRDEMNAAGASEVLLPAMQPAELWKKTDRFKLLEEILITYKDRSGKLNVFGPTHEEVITDLVARDIRSYRDLPKLLYQIQTKFRDEPRPRFGVLRSKEFVMKDAYSFDKDEKGLEVIYKKMHEAYRRIFDRCGLEYVSVEADSGFMGGSESHEFMAPASCGEDKVICGKDKKEKAAIELGHIFKLGTKYSKPLGARYLDEDGKEKDAIMGCYGIGVNRIFAAVIEQNNDKDGMIWPIAIAPYQVLIIVIDPADKDVVKESERIYKELIDSGIETILDDRDERPGIKFKDADLIGFPLKVTVGKKSLKEGKVELKPRKTQKTSLHPSNKIISVIKDHLK